MRNGWNRGGWTLFLCLLLGGSLGQAADLSVQWWTSTEDGSAKLSPQQPLSFHQNSEPASGVQLNPNQRYQSILGLGSSLEHSTCYNLTLLPPERRRQVLTDLLDLHDGIGMSLMRICIGTPDFTASSWYSYNDLPVGETDPELKAFSIARDHEYVLPILREALRINPQLKFFASPWSPPAWMKTNGGITGGRIDPRHFPALARYFVKFLDAYRAEGIPIHALTVQNEPEYAPPTYPTCRWTAAQQRDFIRDHLGPAFAARNIETKIWCFDHNFNNPGFPATILRDPQAARYVDGSAFHLYEGKPAAMSRLRDRFPDKHLYFTEGSTYGVEGAQQIISYFRNWARSYNAWVTLIDHRGQPNPGPHDCDPTAIVLNRDTLELDYRFDYFMYGQFMKFIRPGAVRLGSSAARGLPSNVAFENPDGRYVVIAANASATPSPFRLHWSGKTFAATLPPRSVSTFTWTPEEGR